MTYSLVSFHFYVEVFIYLDNTVFQLVLLHVASTSSLSLVCINKKQPKAHKKQSATEEMFWVTV